MKSMSGADGSRNFEPFDLVMTLLVSLLAPLAVVSSVLLPVPFVGPYLGVALGFVVLFWLGFLFSQANATLLEVIVMSGATLVGLWFAVRTRFVSDPWALTAFTLTGLIPIVWGFNRGLKWLERDEVEAFYRDARTLGRTVVWSVCSGFLCVGCIQISFVGALLLVGILFVLGFFYGAVDLAPWGKAIASFFLVTSIYLGFAIKFPDVENWEVYGLSGMISGAIFFFACFKRGYDLTLCAGIMNDTTDGVPDGVP